MSAEPGTDKNKFLSDDTRRLISGVIKFLDSKDKEFTEKSDKKGDS